MYKTINIEKTFTSDESINIDFIPTSSEIIPDDFFKIDNYRVDYAKLTKCKFIFNIDWNILNSGFKTIDIYANLENSPQKLLCSLERNSNECEFFNEIGFNIPIQGIKGFQPFFNLQFLICSNDRHFCQFNSVKVLAESNLYYSENLVEKEITDNETKRKSL